jgi:hypothetical protein
MTISNIRIVRGMPENEYFANGAISYSKTKNGGADIAPTAKMQLGKKVDAYITRGMIENLDKNELEICKNISKVLIQNFGQTKYTQLQQNSQIAVFAEFDNMPYKGLMDFYLNGIVLDLKISEMPLEKSIPYFGYDRQIGGYMIATGAKLGYLIRVCPKKLTVEIKEITITDEVIDYWEQQILKYGNNFFNGENN